MTDSVAPQDFFLQPGNIVERYEILEPLGYNGVAITYLGIDKALERKVTLKEYFPRPLARRDPDGQSVTANDLRGYTEALGAFYREGRALSRLQHPHIAEVISVVRANDTVYLVTSYRPGANLESWLRGRPSLLKPREAFQLLQPVMQAVEYARNEGIRERGLDPTDIAVAQQNGRPYLILNSFGEGQLPPAVSGGGQVERPYRGNRALDQSSAGSEPAYHTVVHSFGSLLYRMVVGEYPPDSEKRRLGQKLELTAFGLNYSPVVEKAVAPTLQQYSGLSEFEEAWNTATTEQRDPVISPGASANAKAAAPSLWDETSSSGPVRRTRRILLWALLSAVLMCAAGLGLWWQFFRVVGLRASTAAELQSLVGTAAPGSVIEVSGTIELEHPLDISKPLNLVGMGTERSQITGSAEGSLLRFTSDGSLHLSRVRLTQVGNAPSDVLEIVQGELVADDVLIEGALYDRESDQGGRGVWLREEVQSATLSNVVARNNERYGLAARGNTNLSLVGSTFTGNGSGLILDENASARVERSYFTDNLENGLETQGAARLTLETNELRGNGANGLTLGGGAVVEAVKNTMSDNLTGVLAEGEASLTLRESTLSDNQQLGTYFLASASGILRDNVYEGNAVGGIGVREEATPDITGNRFVNNVDFALSVNQGARVGDNLFEGNGQDVVRP